MRNKIAHVHDVTDTDILNHETIEYAVYLCFHFGASAQGSHFYSEKDKLGLFCETRNQTWASSMHPPAD